MDSLQQQLSVGINDDPKTPVSVTLTNARINDWLTKNSECYEENTCNLSPHIDLSLTDESYYNHISVSNTATPLTAPSSPNQELNRTLNKNYSLVEQGFDKFATMKLAANKRQRADEICVPCREGRHHWDSHCKSQVAFTYLIEEVTSNSSKLDALQVTDLGTYMNFIQTKPNISVAARKHMLQVLCDLREMDKRNRSSDSMCVGPKGPNIGIPGTVASSPVNVAQSVNQHLESVDGKALIEIPFNQVNMDNHSMLLPMTESGLSFMEQKNKHELNCFNHLQTVSVGETIIQYRDLSSDLARLPIAEDESEEINACKKVSESVQSRSASLHKSGSLGEDSSELCEEPLSRQTSLYSLQSLKSSTSGFNGPASLQHTSENELISTCVDSQNNSSHSIINQVESQDNVEHSFQGATKIPNSSGSEDGSLVKRYSKKRKLRTYVCGVTAPPLSNEQNVKFLPFVNKCTEVPRTIIPSYRPLLDDNKIALLARNLLSTMKDQYIIIRKGTQCSIGTQYQEGDFVHHCGNTSECIDEVRLLANTGTLCRNNSVTSGISSATLMEQEYFSQDSSYENIPENFYSNQESFDESSIKSVQSPKLILPDDCFQYVSLDIASSVAIVE